MHYLQEATKVEKAYEALQVFVAHDEDKALQVLSEDLKLKDPGSLFAGDVRRLRRFLADIASDEAGYYHMAPWSYSGSMLRFRIGFGLEQGSSASISIWLHLSDDGRIRELDLQYRPEAVISAVSNGIADKAYRLLLFRLGLFRLGRSVIQS